MYIQCKCSHISHMVTYQIYTFVYLNVDYHHQEHFFYDNEMILNFKIQGEGSRS